GGNGVLLGATDDFHSRRGLIGDNIQVFLRASQIVGQRLDLLFEGNKVETCVLVEMGNPTKVAMAIVLEARGIARLSRKMGNFASVLEHPAVIHALKAF